MASFSEAITRGVRIKVRAEYVPELSEPEQHHWHFVYTVRIQNEGEETVQLRARHWIISDAFGRAEEVRGAGVVGVQPVLRPGDTYEYSSSCPLPTPTGAMRGTYEMITEDGVSFPATIAEFALREDLAYN